MRYIDICSGISAPTMAWKSLGWQALCFAEIDKSPRAVLSHHYPEVPLRGDFTEIKGDEYGPVDLVVGGTPCQDYSVAGLRAGVAGDRGSLTLEYSRLAYASGARWMVWENVPGVFSLNSGRDFGAVLATFSGRHGHIFAPPHGGWRNAGIVEPAAPECFGLAWRVLDAQYFGIPQRRRRVFVVGYLGDWRCAAAVLFERHSLSGHPAPRREARPGVADFAPNGPGSEGGGSGRQTNGRATAQAFGGGANCHPTDVATAVAAHPGGRYDIDCETFVAQISGTLASGGNTTGGPRSPGMSAETADTMLIAHTLRAKHNMAHRGDVDTLVTHSLRGEGFDASEDGTGRGTPLVPVCFDTTQVTSKANRSNPKAGDPCHPLAAGAHAPAIAGSSVRRLTPRECERLQGFPDDFTRVPVRRYKAMPTTKHFERYPDLYDEQPDGSWVQHMTDGPRYKMLGNSWARPVGSWIGERIQAVEEILSRLEAAA